MAEFVQQNDIQNADDFIGQESSKVVDYAGDANAYSVTHDVAQNFSPELEEIGQLVITSQVSMAWTKRLWQIRAYMSRSCHLRRVSELQEC
jgi:type II secretory pathway component PulK